MTKLRLLALLAVVALVLFPAIAFAQDTGVPARPCTFHGTVLVNGQNVPDDTDITITVGNDTYTTTTTTEAGVSRYGKLITPPEEASYDSTTTVAFAIEGTTVTGTTATWVDGGNVVQNLSIGTPIEPGGCTCITSAKLGNTTSVSNGVLTINQNAIKGAPGTDGTDGTPGTPGTAGKDANNVLGIVGIVLGVIAIILAVVVMMMRKPQAAPPAPKP